MMEFEEKKEMRREKSQQRSITSGDEDERGERAKSVEK